MCSDVNDCTRLVCFFAHHPSELRSGESRSVHKAPPPLPQRPAHSSQLDLMYAAAQQLAPAPAPASSLSLLLTALQQVQSTMPGVDLLQLLSAVGAVNAPAPAPNADLAAALLQVQLAQQAQAQLQADNVVRQLQPAQVATRTKTDPRKSMASSPGQAPARSLAKAGFSQPVNTIASRSPSPDFGSQRRSDGSPVASPPRVGAPPGVLRSKAASPAAPDHTSFDLWGSDPIWGERTAPKSGGGSRSELRIDSTIYSSVHSSKLSFSPPADAAGDALLDALPRNLSDLTLGRF